ncbi:MAG: beta-N-acetylglucosaminidase domain-containing protein [Succinivibrio sp.]|nr:beta-N-acetylglucosaminidase domain-containing protein [Succinivibrio sp.]
MQTRLGIIEGFYGIQYPQQVRFELMRRVRDLGYSFYIYAPKNESALRSRWVEDYTEDFTRRITNMAAKARELGLDFGFGLSPLNLSANFAAQEQVFCRKLTELLTLTSPELVCLLFDDVKVDSVSQGQMQNKIIRRMLELLDDKVKKVLVCPTFYSFDPILEKLFGACSEHYFSDFLSELPQSVGVFWTGNKVLAEDITSDDLKTAAQRVGRTVSLWDNYPVNDGKRLCERLFLRAFQGRRELNGLCEYHAVNPMNEGLLSTVALSTLPAIYQGKSAQEIELRRLREERNLFSGSLPKLRPYLRTLNELGLKGLCEKDRQRLIALCESQKFKAAAELKAYLEGVYAFDPNCLTS